MRTADRKPPISPQRVMEILDKYHNEGWTQGRLARTYGYAIGTIGRIVRGETHQTLTRNYRGDKDVLTTAEFEPAPGAKESEERMKQLLGLTDVSPPALGAGATAEDSRNEGLMDKFTSEIAAQLLVDVEELKGK